MEQLSLKLGPSFKKLKNQIHKDHPNGFYVRTKPNPYSPNITIEYISKYLGRPVTATSRIDVYNGAPVTFHYQRHEDHETVTECIPVTDFIERLIVHIPDRHFKMVRCYGIWIAPYALFFLYRQIVQSEPRTKNYIGNVVAELHLHLFAMPFFISGLLYTILADLRSFLRRDRWQSLQVIALMACSDYFYEHLVQCYLDNCELYN